MTCPRPEYPRPQFVRPDWLCLNGEWQFAIDQGDSGKERGLCTTELPLRIQVPFCPESQLSGIGNTDFLHAVWYRRTVTIPSDWAGKRALLHFGAVDYDATVWVNDVEMVRHRGGWTGFSCDMGSVAKAGEEATIVVRARDPDRVSQPRGKQSGNYAPADCHYTRTTGIWQTVWLEPVPDVALSRPRLTPDVGGSAIHLEQPITGHGPGAHRPGLALRARLSDGAGVVCEASTPADADFSARLTLAIPEGRRRLWSIRDPFLYDVEIELLDGAGSVVDSAGSYAGLRGVTLLGKQFKLNGETLFQRLVLDQGYYPGGVMTAPTDNDLMADIKLSMDAGFNGARLHQKVFEERFLYHADRLGYLVWGEFGDWGCGQLGPETDHQKPGITYAAQWLEAILRDYSHPSIVGWCPLNETHQAYGDRITTLDDATRAMFLACRALDTSRPILDTSGYSHRVAEADIYDSHDYIEEKDFAVGMQKFRARHLGLSAGKAYANPTPTVVAGETNDSPVPWINAQPKTVWSIPYRGQPYFISEIGGFRWVPNMQPKSAAENTLARKTSWGYGADPASEDEFFDRFEGVCGTLLDDPQMFGYCYTQLTDIYPEENGVYEFDRTPKFDMARLRAIQTRPAAIESEGK